MMLDHPEPGDVWRHSSTGVCAVVNAVAWPTESWMPQEWRIELHRPGGFHPISNGDVTEWWALGWRPFLRPLTVHRRGV